MHPLIVCMCLSNLVISLLGADSNSLIYFTWIGICPFLETHDKDVKWIKLTLEEKMNWSLHNPTSTLIPVSRREVSPTAAALSCHWVDPFQLDPQWCPHGLSLPGTQPWPSRDGLITWPGDVTPGLMQQIFKVKEDFCWGQTCGCCLLAHHCCCQIKLWHVHFLQTWFSPWKSFCWLQHKHRKKTSRQKTLKKMGEKNWWAGAS